MASDLLTLYDIDPDHPDRRGVRAEFVLDRLVLRHAEHGHEEASIAPTDVTSVRLSVSTSSQTLGRVERNFFCSIETGSRHLLEAAAYRPMRSTLGWMRDAPTSDAEARSKAYRQFVQQLHAWLARGRSKADFKFEQPNLDNPGIANALFFAVGLGVPVLVFLLFVVARYRPDLAEMLGIPHLALNIVTGVALVLCGIGALFGAMRLKGWLSHGWARPRPYHPDRIPDSLLPPTRPA